AAGPWRGRAGADQQTLHGFLVLPLGPGVADADREAVAVLDRLRHHPAAEGHLDRVLDVGHADAVARRPLAVNVDLPIVLAPDLPRQHALRPLERLDGGGDRLADPVDRGQVAAEDL